MGTKVPRNEKSQEQKFRRTFNERSWNRKFRGMQKAREQNFFIGTFRSYERKVLGTKSL